MKRKHVDNLVKELANLILNMPDYYTLESLDMKARGAKGVCNVNYKSDRGISKEEILSIIFKDGSSILVEREFSVYTINVIFDSEYEGNFDSTKVGEFHNCLITIKKDEI